MYPNNWKYVRRFCWSFSLDADRQATARTILVWGLFWSAEWNTDVFGGHRSIRFLRIFACCGTTKPGYKPFIQHCVFLASFCWLPVCMRFPQPFSMVTSFLCDYHDLEIYQIYVLVNASLNIWPCSRTSATHFWRHISAFSGVLEIPVLHSPKLQNTVKRHAVWHGDAVLTYTPTYRLRDRNCVAYIDASIKFHSKQWTPSIQQNQQPVLNTWQPLSLLCTDLW